MVAYIVWELNMKWREGAQRYLPHSLWATAELAEGMALIIADSGDAPRWVGVSLHVIDDINARRVNATGKGWKPPFPDFRAKLGLGVLLNELTWADAETLGNPGEAYEGHYE